MPFFNPQNQKAAHHQRRSHAHGVEQHFFDEVVEQQADDGGGDEGDGQVEHEAVGQPVFADMGGHVDEAGAVFVHHGEDGAELDGDVEYGMAFGVEADEAAGHNQVAGAGNGQKFGEAFDDAEEEGFEGEEQVHWLNS